MPSRPSCGTSAAGWWGWRSGSCVTPRPPRMPSPQTLVTAWRELPGLRDPERFEAWLYRILVRACAAEARRLGRVRGGVRDVSPEAVLGSDALGLVADRDEIERGFRRLTSDQRTVIVLRNWADMRQEEIAATLGIPLGTVKSRLDHATAALRGSPRG